MVPYTYFVLFLSIISVVIHFTHGEGNKNAARDCRSLGEVCNDLEWARECGSYDWCKKQAMACGAKKFLLQGSGPMWQDSLKELENNCGNNFEPFKKLYGSSDLVDINLQVNPGREPFTISFDFKEDPTNEFLRQGVSVKLNDKLLYDDFSKTQSSDSAKK